MDKKTFVLGIVASLALGASPLRAEEAPAPAGEAKAEKKASGKKRKMVCNDCKKNEKDCACKQGEGAAAEEPKREGA